MSAGSFYQVRKERRKGSLPAQPKNSRRCTFRLLREVMEAQTYIYVEGDSFFFGGGMACVEKI